MISAMVQGDGPLTQFTNQRQVASADVPPDKGGAGAGFGPHELLEAALATCMAITVQKQARERGYPLKQARCEVRIDRSQPGRVTYHYELFLEGEIDPEQEVVLRDAASRCPVFQTLTSSVEVR
jgi:putative redox protein